MIWANGHLLQSGKYQVIKQIGGGGFGLTYLAADQRLQRKVVIKAPNRTFQQDQDYEKFVRRFQREGEVLDKISHPNIVRVIELFQESGMPCLVMEYVEGETLNQCIRRMGYLPEADAVQYFRQLATALQAVHQVGLIHCDIHPGNIMLRQGTEPILIDFGSTKPLLPMTYTVTTTVNDDYSPYEQRKGDPQPTLDVYGLAAALYFAVTGQKPQPAAMDRKLYEYKLKSPQQHRSELSDWLNQAILSGMALEAQDRTSSMQAWLNLLHPEALKFQSPQLQKRPKRPTSSSQSFPWLSLGFFLLGYIAVGITTGLSNSPPWFWAWFLTLALTLAGSWKWTLAGVWALAGVGSVVGYFTGALSGSLPGGLTGLLIGALTGALIGALMLTFALTLDRVWSLGRAGALVKVGVLGGALALFLVGGGIGGYVTGIGIGSGLGLGLCGLVQLLMIVGGMGAAHTTLQKRYRPVKIFLTYGVFSILGLSLGGGIGWLLKLSGIHLPI
jgi:aminoglycoside phosphotransferase (APT) family kinase protein